jgi:GntR family transcriptional regulator/MocR family aminotransferase
MIPSCKVMRGQGATSFWIEGPPGFDCHRMAAAAREAGVLVEAGEIFFADPAEGHRYFRLGFGSIATNRIEAGLMRLAPVVEAFARGPTVVPRRYTGQAAAPAMTAI